MNFGHSTLDKAFSNSWFKLLVLGIVTALSLSCTERQDMSKAKSSSQQVSGSNQPRISKRNEAADLESSSSNSTAKLTGKTDRLPGIAEDEEKVPQLNIDAEVVQIACTAQSIKGDAQKFLEFLKDPYASEASYISTEARQSSLAAIKAGISSNDPEGLRALQAVLNHSCV